MSETRKTAQQAREGIEQAREAGKAAADSAIRVSKEAAERTEDVFNRTAEEARAISSGVADTMARGAETAADMSQRVAEQGRNVMWLSMRTAAGVNSRFADANYDRGHRALDTAARALDIYRDAAETSAEKVHSLFTSWTQLGRGVQQMQVAYLQLLDRTFRNASRKPQDLMRAKSVEEFAQIQHDLYVDAVNYAFEASSTLMQMAGRVAQDAAPTPPSRALVPAAR